jgi:methanol--5-hydroxybenzimidazolylcobamide Co-methyltransferase
MEQLEYDTRLFNRAIRNGKRHRNILQNLLVDSDIYLDPQALILAPENVIQISGEIVKGSNYIDAAVRGAIKSLDIIEKAHAEKQLKIPELELPWMAGIRSDLEQVPLEESKFIESMMPLLSREKILLDEYGL